MSNVKVNLNFEVLRERESLTRDKYSWGVYATDDIGSFAAGTDEEAKKFLCSKFPATTCELTFFDGRTMLFDVIENDESERVTVVFEIAGE